MLEHAEHSHTGRGDNHTGTPARAKEFLCPQRLTCIPSSSLLMHQKLSASMLRKTSWDRFVTSKFSTSSSAKEREASGRWRTPGTWDNPRGFIRPKLCRRHCNTLIKVRRHRSGPPGLADPSVPSLFSLGREHPPRCCQATKSDRVTGLSWPISNFRGSAILASNQEEEIQQEVKI